MKANEIIGLNNNRVVGLARKLGDGRYQCYAYSHTEGYIENSSVQLGAVEAANWLFREAEAVEVVRVSSRIGRRTETGSEP